MTVQDLATATVSSTQFVGMTLAGARYITATRGSNIIATSVRCDCGSASASSCIDVGTGSFPAVIVSNAGTIAVATALDITNCAYGISAHGGAVVFTGPTATFTGNANTYAVNALLGAQIVFPNTVPAITASTAEMSIDNGALTDTFASLTATYMCLSSLATGSSICRL